jgi:hypothetical protein
MKMKIPHPEKSGFGMTGHFRRSEEGKRGEPIEIA